MSRAILLCVLVACRPASRPALPGFSAILVAGDSSFWIATEGDSVRMRRSPMLVTQLDGRLHELYVTDDDYTHEGALLVGQRVYRRDIVTGDSVVVRQDTAIMNVAKRWISRHPGARRLAPDEDPDEEPGTQATTDITLLDAVGPWLSYESRLDVDAEDEPHLHLTRRAVVDLRTGLPVTLTDLVAAPDARRLESQGRAQLAAAVDSIRQARDTRAARARPLIPAFTFDSSSFELVSGPSQPAIAFLVPGRGERAGGYALPLPELPVTFSAWDQVAGRARPATADTSALTWQVGEWTVRASTDAAGTRGFVQLARGAQRWETGDVPLPVLRLLVLPEPQRDTALHRALRTAFDEAESGGLSRPAALRQPSGIRWPRPASRTTTTRPWKPGLPVSQKPS